MASSTFEHIHKPIPREDFEVGRMKPSSHSAEAISNALIDNLSRSKEELTPIQVRGFEKFKHRGSWSIAQPENVEDVKTFFDILNDIFFNGLLTGYCTLEIFEDTKNRWGVPLGGLCDPAICFESELDSHVKAKVTKCHIAVTSVFYHDGWWQASNESPTVRIKWYLSTLAHEMLHALFFMYECHCERGCFKKCWASYKLWGGHCVHWQAAGHAIERFTQRSEKETIPLLYLDLNLNRELTMVNALQAGANLPNSSEMRRIGLDIESILNKLKRKREIMAERRLEWKQETFGTRKSTCIRLFSMIDNV